MPDLDQRIATWRREMERSGITAANVLDELEFHLREQTKQYLAGMDEESAFVLAVECLGEPEAMRREFAKQRFSVSMPVIVIAGLWAMSNIVMAAVLIRNGLPIMHTDLSVSHESGGFLLVNFITAIAGTSAVYASGILAMCYVWLQWRERLSIQRERALVRAIEIFNGLIASLTAVTILCGMLWIKRETGSFFPAQLPSSMGTWTAATASLIMMAWFAAIFASHRFWKSNLLLLMMLQFGGNLVVLLPSFGVHLHHVNFSWFIDGSMDTWIALNVFFLLLAATLKKSERLAVA